MSPKISNIADIVWVTEEGDYSAITTRKYLRVVADFAKQFGKSPEKLGLNELRTYQAYLLRERKLTPGPMSELCREFGISRKTGYKIFIAISNAACRDSPI